MPPRKRGHPVIASASDGAEKPRLCTGSSAFADDDGGAKPVDIEHEKKAGIAPGLSFFSGCHAPRGAGHPVTRSHRQESRKAAADRIVRTSRTMTPGGLLRLGRAWGGGSRPRLHQRVVVDGFALRLFRSTACAGERCCRPWRTWRTRNSAVSFLFSFGPQAALHAGLLETFRAPSPALLPGAVHRRLPASSHRTTHRRCFCHHNCASFG